MKTLLSVLYSLEEKKFSCDSLATCMTLQQSNTEHLAGKAFSLVSSTATKGQEQS